MTKQEIEEQYPKIAKLVWAIQTPNPESIGIYTSKMEREGDFEKLSQWIRYWAKVDCLQAVVILNKLKKIGAVEREELKQIILDEMTHARNMKARLFYVMLAFLYFGDYEKVKDLYELAKYKAEKKQGKILIARTIEEVNVRLRKYIAIHQKCTDVFVNWNSQFEIAQALEQIIPSEEEQQKRQILQEVIQEILQTQDLWEQEKSHILKMLNALSIESQKEVLYISRNSEAKMRRIENMIRKEMELTQDEEKKLAQKEVLDHLLEKLDTLLQIVASEEERTIAWLRPKPEQEEVVEEEPLLLEELVEELGEKEENLREYWKQYFTEAERTQVDSFCQKSRMAQEMLEQIYLPQRFLSTKKIAKWQELLRKIETEVSSLLSEEEKQQIQVLLDKMEELRGALFEHKRETIATKLPQIQEMYQMLKQVTEAVYEKGNQTLAKVTTEKETITKEDCEQIQKLLTLFQVPHTVFHWEQAELVANQTWKLQKQLETIAKTWSNKTAVFHSYALDFLHISENGKQKKIQKAQKEMLTANRQLVSLILEKKPELEKQLEEPQEKLAELEKILERIQIAQQRKVKQETPQEECIIGKKYYIAWLRQQMPELEDCKKSFDLASLQDKIIESLLKESNYSLIFQYIHILQICGDYETIHPKVRRFALANKNTNRPIIQEIVREFIQRGEVHLAFEFLRYIGVKNYLEYMPQEISVEESIEILGKKNNTLGNLYVQKQLFFGKQNKDLLQCTKDWIQYLEQTREIQKTELVHQMVLILELLDKDFRLLQDSFVQEKIQQFTQTCQERKISLRGEYAILLLVKVLNQILASPISNEEKLAQIQALQVLNQFTYKQEEVIPFRYLRDTIFTTKKIEAKNLYQEWSKNITAQDAKTAVDLYMNTHWKHVVQLEEFLQVLEQINAEKIEEYFEPYTFYGVIKSVRTYFRFKIQSVNVLNRTRISGTNFLQREDFRTQTYQAKISGYSSIYHEILVKDVRALTEQTVEMPQEERGNNNTNSTLAELPSVLSQEDEKTNRMLEKQYDQLQNIEENEIENLKQNENENPFCFISWDTIKRDNYWNVQKTLNRVKTIQTQLTKNIDRGKGSFRQMYRERFIEIYQEWIETEKMSAKLLVDLYMNTVSKYLIPLDEFIRLLVRDRQGVTDLSVLFQDYPIIFRTIQDGKIQAPLLFETGELYGTEEMLSSIFMDPIRCMLGKIQSYDTESKSVQVGQIKFVKLLVPSEESAKLKQILGKYRDTRDGSVLEELEDLAVIPELTSKSSMEVSENRFIIAELEALTRNIVSLLLGQVEQLQKFLQLLGKNNYFVWRERYGITKHFEAKDAKRIFLEQAKTTEVSTMLYCYNNTYLKYVFGLDELIQALLQAEKIPQESGSDLTEYQIQIRGKIVAKEERYWLLDCNTAFFANLPPLKIKLDQELEENTFVQLQVKSYDRIYNVFSCQPVVRTSYVNYEEAYVRQYIATVHTILRKNPTLEEIFEFMQTEYMQSRTFWIYRRIEDRCYPQTSRIIRKHAKYWNQTIRQFLQAKMETGELNAENLNEVFRIYKMGLLKLSLRLNEFLELCSPILNTMKDGLQEEIKLVVNEKNEKYYQVYFPKYRIMMKAQFQECTEKIEISQRYRAQILQYNPEEQCVILHHLRRPKVFQNTTLFTIAPEMQEDLLMPNETIQPITEEAKKEELKQYIVSQKAEIQESIEQAIKGFASIEKMEDREELNQLGRHLQEKIEQNADWKEISETGYDFVKFILDYQDLAVNETGEITSLEPLRSEAKKWEIEISSSLEHEQVKNLNFLRPFIRTEIAEVVAKLLRKRQTYLESFAFMKLVTRKQINNK